LQLRRGLSIAGGAPALLEAFDVPDVGAYGVNAPLSWEEACRRRAACVILDEEEQTAGLGLAM